GSGWGRHGTWAGDLPRLRRSHARDHHRGEPYRPHRCDLCNQVADPAERSAAGHSGMSAAPLKILVVDDEPPIRKLLRMGLSTQGYEILEAPSGKASIDLLAQNPDLIILYLGLPGIQVLELRCII